MRWIVFRSLNYFPKKWWFCPKMLWIVFRSFNLFLKNWMILFKKLVDKRVTKSIQKLNSFLWVPSSVFFWKWSKTSVSFLARGIWRFDQFYTFFNDFLIIFLRKPRFEHDSWHNWNKLELSRKSRPEPYLFNFLIFLQKPKGVVHTFWSKFIILRNMSYFEMKIKDMNTIHNILKSNYVWKKIHST